MRGSSDWIEDGWWAAVAVRLLHPVQMEIIEAVAWIERPLSPSELRDVFNGEYGLSQIAYHLQRLCRLCLLELEEEVQVRGVLGGSYRPARLERSDDD